MIEKKDFGFEILFVFVMSVDVWEKVSLINENALVDGDFSGGLKGVFAYF